MQVTPENLSYLRGCLEQTLNPDAKIRKEAEAALIKVETQSGFPIVILTLIEAQDPAFAMIRQSAAVFFKNFVKKHWDLEKDDGTPNAITAQDRSTIKTNLVTLMCNTPDQIQKQLSEALSTIGQYDFPDNWKNLLPELTSKLNSDWRIVNGVLQTANAIFKRFRYVFRSDELYKELSHCLTQFQQPLLDLFKFARQQLVQNAGDKATVMQIMQAQRTMCRIFFSLNWQDIPAFFEDHIAEWMEEFAFLLQYSNPLVVDESEEQEPGCIDAVQHATVCNLNLYAEKYEEEFKPYLENFARLIWQLLSGQVTVHPKHDLLAATCMKFLRAVAMQPKNKAFFEIEGALQEICSTIVVRNLKLRTSDEELFEDNPMDFIRRDIEGSDGDTRRSAARELVRGLLRNFHEPVTKICSALATQMLAANEWHLKDVAINLVIALAVQKESRSMGVTEVNPLVPVLEFFTMHILPELSSPTSPSMLLRADALKYVSTFRNQLSAEYMVSLAPYLINMLIPDQFVVHTYAASCIERMMTVKNENGQGLRFGQAQLQPHLLNLLQQLFAILEQPNYPENDYLMKAVMRIINVAKADILPVTNTAVTKLTAILKRICANPSNPTFAHYLFEAISVLVQNVCSAVPTATEQFETLLLPPFQEILTAGIEALCPYVYQVLAQLLDLRPQGVSPAYMQLFPCLLTADLWKRVSDVTALSKLMESYIRKSPEQILPNLQPYLGIFQQLISAKSTEASAFVHLRGVFGYLPLSAYQSKVPDIFICLMKRLQSRMTARMGILYTKDMLYSISVFIGKNGAVALFDTLQNMQPGMGAMLLRDVWMPNFMKIRGVLERKTVAIGMNRILCEVPEVLSNQTLWIEVLNGILQLFEDKQEVAQVKDASDQLAELEETGYEAGFSKLYFASSKPVDLLPEFPSAKHHLATSLSTLSTQRPGVYLPLVQHQLEPKRRAVLESFFTTAQLPFQ